MNLLAEALRSTADHDGAIQMHRETLRARRRVLGGSHPQALRSTYNLAFTLHAAAVERIIAGKRAAKDEQRAASDAASLQQRARQSVGLVAEQSMAASLEGAALGEGSAKGQAAATGALGWDQLREIGAAALNQVLMTAACDFNEARELYVAARRGWTKLVGAQAHCTRLVEFNLEKLDKSNAPESTLPPPVHKIGGDKRDERNSSPPPVALRGRRAGLISSSMDS